MQELPNNMESDNPDNCDKQERADNASVSSMLSVRNVCKKYPIQSGVFKRTVGYNEVLNDISFDVIKGETLAIVGESGCGKSTLSRLMLCLEKPTSGEIYYLDKRIDNLSYSKTKALRKEIQIVFQDSSASLNERFSVEQILNEPLLINNISDKAGRQAMIDEVLVQVGLDASFRNRYQHELSGGQCQRVSIARSIILKPKLLLLDEPLSALDVSMQRQLVDLFGEIQKSLNLTIILISHNLNLVHHFSDRTLVLNFGKIAEFRPTEELFAAPENEYTKALLASNLSN